MNAETLVKSYAYTADVIHRQLVDVTHEESLEQVGPHSINWLLGHIVSARAIPLKRVGAAQVWDDESRSRYRNGSAPITADEPGVLRLEDLLTLFEQSQERLIAGLRTLTPEQLRADSGYGGNSVFESFLYFHFHETYHLGQLTMVAEGLGKPSAYLDL
jgi:uncharacterized damage-inducible protein DinB